MKTLRFLGWRGDSLVMLIALIIIHSFAHRSSLSAERYRKDKIPMNKLTVKQFAQIVNAHTAAVKLAGARSDVDVIIGRARAASFAQIESESAQINSNRSRAFGDLSLAVSEWISHCTRPDDDGMALNVVAHGG